VKHLIFWLALIGLAVTGQLPAAERIPPAPPRYFNDYAGVVAKPVADQLNAHLEQFERESSNQLLVVIYPKMESASSVEDYTVRVAQAWRVGQQGRNNGAVLFSFMQERQLYLQVGYGLEGAIPDALAKRIIEREIVPRFRAGDINGGMTAAVNAMIAAAKGEYQGTGRTVAERHSPAVSGSRAGKILGFIILTLFIGAAVLFIYLIRRSLRQQPTVFHHPQRDSGLPRTPWWMSGGGSGGSTWGGGSSWGGGGGGGGFSGGGGSFGGGGAGGKW